MAQCKRRALGRRLYKCQACIWMSDPVDGMLGIEGLLLLSKSTNLAKSECLSGRWQAPPVTLLCQRPNHGPWAEYRPYRAKNAYAQEVR
jgi:hypothetical protein